MDEPDHVDVLLEFFDEIAFGDLFVEEVVEELHLRMVDGADDLNGFGGGLQEVLGVFFGIDALKEETYGLPIDLFSFYERAVRLSPSMQLAC